MIGEHKPEEDERYIEMAGRLPRNDTLKVVQHRRAAWPCTRGNFPGRIPRGDVQMSGRLVSVSEIAFALEILGVSRKFLLLSRNDASA